MVTISQGLENAMFWHRFYHDKSKTTRQIPDIQVDTRCSLTPTATQTQKRLSTFQSFSLMQRKSKREKHQLIKAVLGGSTAVDLVHKLSRLLSEE
jgi:hypothetical protein